MRNRQIATPPYESGPNRHKRIEKWNEENLFDLTDAERELLSLASSEATIRWNRSGGQPSGYFNAEKRRAIEAINTGAAITFPNVEWNREMIERERQQREFG
jgi:hypothetical protein